MRRVFFNSLILIFVFNLLVIRLCAQSLTLSIDFKKDTSIHALNINDDIPDKLWSTVLPVLYHPQKKENIYLSDFRSKKLIIIDFWATWCAPCIASLKKLQVIEKKYPDLFALLPVTYEKFDFLQKQMVKLNFHPFSVHSDPTLLQYFPHRSIPHQIWIVNDTVVHIGNANDANEKNILLAMNGHIPKMRVKTEFLDYELTKPLDEFAKKANTASYKKSVMTGPINGIGGSYGIMKAEGQKLLYYNNASIMSMLSYALDIPLNRMYIDTVNRSNKRIESQKACYQLIVPELTSDDRMKVLFKDDLTSSFGFNISKEQKKTNVIKVFKSRNVDKPKLEKLKYSMEVRSLVGLLNLNFKWKNGLPIYTPKVPLEAILYSDEPIGPAAKNQKLLADLLQLNGMSLMEDVEDLEVLIVESN